MRVSFRGRDGCAAHAKRACLAGLALLLAGCAASPAEPAPADRQPQPPARDAPPSPSPLPSPPSPSPTAPNGAPQTMHALRTGTLRITAEPLGTVPNSGLLLPAICPDGRWIAALRAADGAEVYPEDLFTGRRLGPVELVLAPVSDPADQRTIVPRGAAWPAWSAEGGGAGRLVAVTYDDQGAPRLAVHDPRTDQTQTLAPGFRRIIAPRFSPDGRRIAFAAHGAQAVGARIYILDLERRTTAPAPAPHAGADLLFPQWVDDRTLIFFRVDEGGAEDGHDAAAAATVTVRRWRIGRESVDDIAALRVHPPNADGLFQSLASIADPLSPDGRRLLYYSPEDRRLIALDLATGQQRPLAADSFAACWLAPSAAAIATGNDLLLAFPADRSPPRQLTHGRTIPRRADPRQGHILFLTPGDSPWSFQLIRLHFAAAGADGRP